MSTYEERRLENIKRNQALLNELGIEKRKEQSLPSKRPPTKKRKFAQTQTPRPTRTSARIASTPRTTYTDEPSLPAPLKRTKKAISTALPKAEPKSSHSPPPAEDTPSLIASWTTWTAEASPPTRDENGTYHFATHADFEPNKSPLEILSEGGFGGSFYRPVYSKTLRITISDDYLSDLPASWLDTLNPGSQVLRTEYEPEVNKHGVRCGQSIEEHEAAGWIDYNFDARGWFQWYVRFFRGRRCGDDERQIGRWRRCCGPRGRWRRALLKAYLKKGVRSVADEGDEEAEVSAVLCQTCLHWAWEVRQDELDAVWANGLD